MGHGIVRILLPIIYLATNSCNQKQKTLVSRKESAATMPTPAPLTPYEAAVKVGLIGCFQGPPDLALNHRKYARRAVRTNYLRAKRAR